MLVSDLVEKSPIALRPLLPASGNVLCIHDVGRLPPLDVGHQRVPGMHPANGNLTVHDEPLGTLAGLGPGGQLRIQVKHSIPGHGDIGWIVQGAQLVRFRRDDHVLAFDLAPRRRRIANLIAPFGRVRIAQDEAGRRHAALYLDGHSAEIGLIGNLDIDEAAEGIRGKCGRV